MSNLIAAIALALVNIAEAAATSGNSSLGGIVLAIIEFPVLTLILATILGKPRSNKMTGLFLGWVTMMATVYISAFYLLSWLTSIFY